MTKKTLRYNCEVMDIMNNRQMTDQEKTGHIRQLIRSEKEDDITKLEILLHWLTGVRPPRFWGKFDQNTRVFQLSFEPDVYFDQGGKQYMTLVVQRMMHHKFPIISFPRADHWVGHFPFVVEEKQTIVRKAEKPSEKVKEISENEYEAPVTKIEEPKQPEMQVKVEPKVEQPKKVVRKKANERKPVKPIKVEETDEDIDLDA